MFPDLDVGRASRRGQQLIKMAAGRKLDSGTRVMGQDHCAPQVSGRIQARHGIESARLGDRRLDGRNGQDSCSVPDLQVLDSRSSAGAVHCGVPNQAQAAQQLNHSLLPICHGLCQRFSTLQGLDNLHALEAGLK